MLDLSSSVEGEIGSSAFRRCGNVKKIKLPKNVHIGTWAFEGLTNIPVIETLQEDDTNVAIEYGGTLDEWKNCLIDLTQPIISQYTSNNNA